MSTNDRHPDDEGGRAFGRALTALRTNRKVQVGTGVAILVFLAVLVAVYRHFARRQSTDDAHIDGHIAPISARVGGPVAEVLFEENQEVRAGDVLLRLDTRDLEVARQQAEADLAEARAALDAASAGVPIASTTTTSDLSSASAALASARAGLEVAGKQVDEARARLRSARARLDEAEAEKTRADHDLERMEQLVGRDEVSRQQYDDAVAGAASAAATVESARALVDEADQGVRVAESRRAQAERAVEQAQAGLRTAGTGPKQVAITEARRAQAEARVKQAEAALERARLDLEYAEVRAPWDGVVARRSVEVGQVIVRGQPLLALVDLRDVWVVANFKETQLRGMRPGQRATISVDAFGGRTFRGRVESIAPATGSRFSLLPPENATGNYVKVVQRIPVRIAIEPGEDPDHRLRPGMSVVPTVLLD